jgi:predicted dehydrogenase
MNLQIPETPLRVALIGAGRRSMSQYLPMIPSLSPWLEFVSVCDPVADHAAVLAAQIGVQPFTDIHDLVVGSDFEAAIVVTPVQSHHSISSFLSSKGIHHLVETSFASSLTQARDMVDTARRNNVTVRVAENFFRMPVDRIVAKIRESGDIGDIKRIVSYADHTGYHNNSRWIAFAGTHPEYVRAVEHTIPTAAFSHTAERHYETETYQARFFEFPDNLLIVDHAANIKGFLGRYSRPGYTEWQGERGTIIWRAVEMWTGGGEVRICSDEALANGAGRSDIENPIVTETDEEDRWIKTYVDLPSGRAVWENPIRLEDKTPHPFSGYNSAIVDHMLDFALTVRGIRESEFDGDDAVMSTMMEVAAKESVRTGERIALPLDYVPESDQKVHANLQAEYGVDPLDVDAMLGVSFPTP